jgi:hypothetical protein
MVFHISITFAHFISILIQEASSRLDERVEHFLQNRHFNKFPTLNESVIILSLGVLNSITKVSYEKTVLETENKL